MSAGHSRRTRLIDLTGQRFGRLVVVRRDGADNQGVPTWLCHCDCGRDVVVRGSHLRRGAVISCNCSRGRTSWEPVPVEGDDSAIGVPLTQGRIAVIDSADMALVTPFIWSLRHRNHTDYAETRTGNRLLLMHRLIMAADDDHDVDHRDGNGLNNRRGNLRLATRSQNLCNRRRPANTSSRFRGVCFDKQTGRWTAQIGRDGKCKRLGRFVTEEEAALAYDSAARQLHGEFATVNFP